MFTRLSVRLTSTEDRLEGQRSKVQLVDEVLMLLRCNSANVLHQSLNPVTKTTSSSMPTNSVINDPTRI